MSGMPAMRFGGFTERGCKQSAKELGKWTYPAARSPGFAASSAV
jgi:hypothetical protein